MCHFLEHHKTPNEEIERLANAQMTAFVEEMNDHIEESLHPYTRTIISNLKVFQQALPADIKRILTKTSKSKDTQHKCADVLAALKASQENAEAMLKTFAVFVPPLINGKVPLLEAMASFFGNAEMVNWMLSQLWESVDASVTVALSDKEFMEHEREAVMRTINEAKERRPEGPDKRSIRDVSAFMVRLHMWLRRFYTDLWNVRLFAISVSFSSFCFFRILSVSPTIRLSL